MNQKNFSNIAILDYLVKLYAVMNMYRKTRQLLQYQLRKQDKLDSSLRESLTGGLAYLLACDGNYRESLKLLKRQKFGFISFQCLESIIRAECYLGQGKLYDAETEAGLAIERAEKEGIKNYLHTSTLIQGAIYSARGDSLRANKVLCNILPFFKKTHMERELTIRRLLLKENFDINQHLLDLPVVRLVYFLRLAEQSRTVFYYKRALQVAVKHGMLGKFLQYLLFFPEVVKEIFSGQLPSEIPRSFLLFPLFQKGLFVFHIDFLGRFRVFRNNMLWSAKLSPIEQAFMVRLALNKGGEMAVDLLNKNFWPRSTNSHNLSELLWRLRKKLPTFNQQVQHQLTDREPRTVF